MDKEIKTGTDDAAIFIRGAMIVVPSIVSLVGSVGTIIWFAAGLNNRLDVLQEKFEAEKSNRISLEVDVKLNSKRLGDQAVILGRFEEKLNNVEKTGNETLELLRDYTGRH